jgi:hypothetical protein
MRRREELVGRAVRVEGRVFFLSRCPPPSAEGGSTGECQLTGYLADPRKQSLDEHERDSALLLAEGGTPVTCAASQSQASACPGWRHATSYRLVVRVDRQVLGGRTTQYVQLEALEKEAR